MEDKVHFCDGVNSWLCGRERIVASFALFFFGNASSNPCLSRTLFSYTIVFGLQTVLIMYQHMGTQPIDNRVCSVAHFIFIFI